MYRREEPPVNFLRLAGSDIFGAPPLPGYDRKGPEQAACQRSGLLKPLVQSLDRTGFIVGLLLGGYALWCSRRPQPNVERTIIAIHAAALAFAISIIASIARALPAAQSDTLVWATGGIEALCILAIWWQLRTMVRHASIAQLA